MWWLDLLYYHIIIRICGFSLCGKSGWFQSVGCNCVLFCIVIECLEFFYFCRSWWYCCIWYVFHSDGRRAFLGVLAKDLEERGRLPIWSNMSFSTSVALAGSTSRRQGFNRRNPETTSTYNPSVGAPVPYREHLYEYKPDVLCHCGLKVPQWISWRDKNPGRRYNKCRHAWVSSFLSPASVIKYCG